MKNKTVHLFENSLYHISSSCNARNPLFINKAICDRFLEKVDHYLAPLCDILHYSIVNNEVQLIVKLKDRKTIINAYKKRKNDKVSFKDIPPSTYIFSKAMSDLLVSTVKHFNYHFQRKGGMIARRFKRNLITNKLELEYWMKQIRAMKAQLKQKQPWNKFPSAYKLHKRRSPLKRLKYRSAEYYYLKENIGTEHHNLKGFKRINYLDLRGYFKIIPPYTLFEKYNRIWSQNLIPKTNNST